jgi:hypothetical protein
MGLFWLSASLYSELYKRWKALYSRFRAEFRQGRRPMQTIHWMHPEQMEKREMENYRQQRNNHG